MSVLAILAAAAAGSPAPTRAAVGQTLGVFTVACPPDIQSVAQLQAAGAEACGDNFALPGDITFPAFEAAINRLAAAGIVKGCSATLFCPRATVTRGQIAAFLDRALHPPTTATDFFSDDDGSSFEAAINRLAAAGIVKGCTQTTFCPTATATREQMAALLHRALGSA